MKHIFIFLLGVWAINTQASDLEEFQSLSNVALKVGTLGIGIEIEDILIDNVHIRGNLHKFNYSAGNKLSQITYKSKFETFTAGVLLDYYPDGENLRFTSGVYYMDNSLDGVATISSKKSLKFGKHRYKGAIKKINTTVDFNHYAPYVGLGIGTKKSEHVWNLTLDAGVLYQGKPQITVNPILHSKLPQIVKEQIISDIGRERRKIQSHINKYKFYPVIMLGASYKF
jgi:hypothetical protein